MRTSTRIHSLIKRVQRGGQRRQKFGFVVLTKSLAPQPPCANLVLKQGLTMTLNDLFLYADLTPADKITFARAFQTCLQIFGREKCWRLEKLKHVSFEGFSVSSKTAVYRGNDVRPLLLGFMGEFQEEGEITVRRGICKSPYCINPSHYYWGDRSHVQLEKHIRCSASKKPNISAETIKAMRQERENGGRVLDISRKYRVSYSTAQRICSGRIYADLEPPKQQYDDNLRWELLIEVCRTLVDRYPSLASEHSVALRMYEKMECPWHQPGFPGHKGNFGLMGECLDCMEEIKNGRCTVDVTQFSMDWYWQIKRFWEQVDIKGEDECWPWLGTTRRGNSESIAYFPSPFHSGKTQSAPRVAFWLSRGYTGKYKVFSQTSCEPFCCNPRHLTIREFKDMLPPAKIEKIQLHFGNVFDQYRKSISQMQSGSGE